MLKLLWEELDIGLEERHAFNGLLSNATSTDVLNRIWSRQLKKLMRLRLATIEALRAIDEREMVLEKIKSRVADGHYLTPTPTEAAQKQVRKNKVLPVHENESVLAERLVEASVAVVEAIVDWRTIRERPATFYWKGHDYLLRMRSDIDELSSSHETRTSMQQILLSQFLPRQLSKSALAVLLPSRAVFKDAAYIELAAALRTSRPSSKSEREWLVSNILSIEPVWAITFKLH